jgi:hypothetical protein
MARGIDVATAEIRETDAAVLWPARMVWAGPETITTLIEAHGLQPGALITPAYHGQRGWPVLVPVSAAGALAGMPSELMPDAVLDGLRSDGLPELLLEVGDPGTVLDASVARTDLPPYEGPPTPVGEHIREWGAAVAEEPDDAPMAGPSLAPYPQAADEQEA